MVLIVVSATPSSIFCVFAFAAFMLIDDVFVWWLKTICNERVSDLDQKLKDGRCNVCATMIDKGGKLIIISGYREGLDVHTVELLDMDKNEWIEVKDRKESVMDSGCYYDDINEIVYVGAVLKSSSSLLSFGVDWYFDCVWSDEYSRASSVWGVFAGIDLELSFKGDVVNDSKHDMFGRSDTFRDRNEWILCLKCIWGCF